MGDIYRNAFFTIIAAGRNSTNLELRGLDSHSPRTKSDVVRLDNVSLVSTAEPLVTMNHHPISICAWDTRGWTLQEWILSRRRLIFSEEQIYWECETSTWWEELCFESDVLTHDVQREACPLLSTEFRLKYLLVPDRSVFMSAFWLLCSRYSLRQLSDLADRYRAIVGLVEIVGRQGTLGRESIWGLLLSEFETQLCWTLGRDLVWRYAIDLIPETSQASQPIPSWSWLSWMGEVEPPISGHIQPSIRFYTLPDNDTQPFLLGNLPAIDTFPWSTGCRTEVSVSDIHGLLDRGIVAPVRSTFYHLFFWTSSARILVKWIYVDSPGRNALVSDRGSPQTDIFMTAGNTYDLSSGGNRSWANPQYGCNRLHDCRADIEGEDHIHEFVAMGRLSQAIQRTDHVFYSDTLAPPQLQVMLITWDDGVAQRAGLGTISEDDWMRSERSWRLIVLN